MSFEDAALLAAILLILAVPGGSRYYEVREAESGWTTGLRHSIDASGEGLFASLQLSGYVIGEGKYSRYTEADLNDVRMRERISASEGTLDTSEGILLIANTTSEVEERHEKIAGGQDYRINVSECWPALVFASRIIDYRGIGISDRETFGNNLDYAGSSYMAEDLLKRRTCSLELDSVWFEALINDTTDTVVRDVFQPNKSLEYRLESYSDGLVGLKYRQAQDRLTARVGEEEYAGNFEISRRLLMSNRYCNSEEEKGPLECCQPRGVMDAV
ncbi:MAG: hypothetical protein QUS08_10550 [Methanothrix sp.]|nr:hypothetical protein [Methanothrix sp.]